MDGAARRQEGRTKLTGLELVGPGATEFGVAGLRRAMLDGAEAKLRTA